MGALMLLIIHKCCVIELWSVNPVKKMLHQSNLGPLTGWDIQCLEDTERKDDTNHGRPNQ